jgi:GxxExxY protein
LRLNELTFKVRGAIFEVYKILGPGLLESTYEAALGYEFKVVDQEYKIKSLIH